MNHLVKAEDDSKFGNKAAGLPAAIEPKTEIKRQNDEQFLEVISRRQYTLKMRTLTTTLKKKGFFRMSALQKNALKYLFSTSMSDARKISETGREMY